MVLYLSKIVKKLFKIFYAKSGLKRGKWANINQINVCWMIPVGKFAKSVYLSLQ